MPWPSGKEGADLRQTALEGGGALTLRLKQGPGVQIRGQVIVPDRGILPHDSCLLSEERRSRPIRSISRKSTSARSRSQLPSRRRASTSTAQRAAK